MFNKAYTPLFQALRTNWSGQEQGWFVLHFDMLAERWIHCLIFSPLLLNQFINCLLKKEILRVADVQGQACTLEYGLHRVTIPPALAQSHGLEGGRELVIIDSPGFKVERPDLLVPSERRKDDGVAVLSRMKTLVDVLCVSAHRFLLTARTEDSCFQVRPNKVTRHPRNHPWGVSSRQRSAANLLLQPSL